MSLLLGWLDGAFLGDRPVRTRLAYLGFAGALLVTLGSQQFIAPVKIAMFMGVVGARTEPVARSLLLLVMVPVLVAYSLAYSRLKSATRLAASVCGIYAAAFVVIAAAMARAGDPPAWSAWLLYYAAETKGVIVLPMLWSMLNDVTPPELAPAIFPTLFFLAQLGGIGGSLIAANASHFGGELGLMVLQVVALVLVAAFVWVACALLEAERSKLRGWSSYASVEDGRRPHSTSASSCRDLQGDGGRAGHGFGAALVEGFEGLVLLCTRPYVLGAFFVSYAGIVPRALLEYENSIAGMAAYSSKEERIAAFGRVGLCVNVGTAALALLGVRPIVERIGVAACLEILPAGALICVAAVCVDRSLTTTTVALVTASALTFGLNSPVKEMLYVRTSKDIKYKAKSWSAMYGHQLMKVIGAQVNLWVDQESPGCAPGCFHPLPTLSLAIAWAALWCAVVHQVGVVHRRLEREDTIVA